MTPYELWQLEKYGNIIPEGEINEQDYEWNSSYTNVKDIEAVCDSERPAFSYDQVRRDNEGLSSLPDFL